MRKTTTKKSQKILFNFKLLGKFKRKIFSMIFSKIIIIFAAAFTTTHVVASDLSPPSLVPHSPLTPQLPTRTVSEIVKTDHLTNMSNFLQKK